VWWASFIPFRNRVPMGDIAPNEIASSE